MRVRTLLGAIRLRRAGASAPVPARVWPEDAALWLDENGARHPRSARHALSALAALGARGRYAARAEGGAKILAGPASALTLHDAEAETRFVLRVTPLGYGDERL